MEKGYFFDEGITDVELISFDASQDELMDREELQVELLARGAVDLAVDPRTSFVLEARDKKRAVSIVAARRKSHAFILLGQKGLKSIEDLRGRTVDMGQRGGASDVMMRQLLTDQGLEPDKDVHFMYEGGGMHDLAAHAKSFREGKRGPVCFATDATLPDFVADGYPILADLRKLYPARHDRVTASNEEFCREQPELLKSCLKALIRGCRFVLTMDKEWFEEFIRGRGFLRTESEIASYSALQASWEARISRDLALPIEGVELIADEEKKAGRISAS
jgi:ABC-type nitrate/sulfonate/bicarbonate transport system substrate-binding protein